jgi:hypothetical protein
VCTGDVPKFFDGVLSKRAGEAVTLKGHWWDARRDVALEGVKEKQFKVGEGGGYWGQCRRGGVLAVVGRTCGGQFRKRGIASISDVRLYCPTFVFAGHATRIN